MNIHELLNKRILVKNEKRQLFGNSEIIELIIIEISPSENWVKVRNMNGNKYWQLSSSLAVIEVLKDIKVKANIDGTLS